MRFLPFLLGTLPSLFPTIGASTTTGNTGATTTTTEILYWPLGASQPSTLARIAYDPINPDAKAHVLAYTPPTAARNDQREREGNGERLDNDQLVRLGIFTKTATNPKQWTGSLVSMASVAGSSREPDGTAHPPTVRLHLGPDNEVYHVSLAAGETISRSASQVKSKAKGEMGSEEVDRTGDVVPLQVELVKSEDGVQPHLNRPVVVRPDGQNPEDVPEKTLMQK